MSQHNNGGTGYGVGDKQRSSGPASELEVYDRASRATEKDEFLKDVNLGLGNYSNREYWMQMESLRDGKFADAAFSMHIKQRAITQTKLTLALEGYRYYGAGRTVVGDADGEPQEDARHHKGWNELSDEEQAEHESKRKYLQERGEEIWNALTEQRREEAVQEVVGDTDWLPPQWFMLTGRHEASRGKAAHLLDTLFGRVREVRGTTEDAIRRGLEGGN